MNSLAIIGAGGHGKVIADIASQCGYELIDFYDDGKQAGQIFGAWKVKGTVEDLEKQQSDYCGIVVAIGQNDVRSALIQKFALQKRITLIHPSSVISIHAQIGAGTVIMPRAVVNAFAQIGEGVIINTSSVVEHDCRIGNFSHISPGAVLSGNVHVGDYCWLGANCSIRQNVFIGSGAIVGIGAVVVKEVKPAATVIGSPAKELLK
ncbi:MULTISPECIES: acetyltransferase [unclassified Vibrio]|uniref:acetyltransferase n=1 Tax=unclassified Vibrio TaxID=2614977 RepID=UPI000B8E764C|nr:MULTISPECIES: acetyltransferase [unclassified Vibrio]NAW98854.1 pilin glycosylation protein [Vibrio sp. V23_P3S9T160]OXX42442.1 pilin glycosylation protein [Vibrio sp. V11_P1A41T118]PRQ63740.1 pilin glycosylation protein [Vibrio sp. V01_P9A10T6]